MFKLVALDVDGTLLNDNYELSDNSIQIIRGIADTGVRIILCTGRSPISLKEIQNKMKLDEPCIVHNGGLILDANGTTINAYNYSIQRLSTIIDYCRREKLHFNACTDHNIYVESDGYEEQYNKYFLKPIKLDNILSLADPIVKFSIYADESDVDLCLEQEWSSSIEFSVVRVGKGFIDVMLKGVSKGSALNFLADKLGYMSQDVLAFGDQYNDVEMLRYAGLGIAMGNAPDEVKRNAAFITEDNNTEGVAKALTRIYKINVTNN